MKPRIATTIAVIISICCLGAASSRARARTWSPFAAWNIHDADKVASFYTDDVVYEDVVYEDVAFGLKAHGHAEMRKLAADFFAGVPDLKLEVVSNTSMGNRGYLQVSHGYRHGICDCKCFVFRQSTSKQGGGGYTA